MVPKSTEMPHLGHLLTEKMQRRELTKSRLARLMGRTASSVHSYVSQPSFQAGVLWDASHALGINLFDEISGYLPEDFPENPDARHTKTIAGLQARIAELEKENSILREIIGVKMT